ncbi:hypothetical protein, partial [Thiolapillus sp.]|uniref:hypothetical protein n=1 Tax=Thiolapillus sp. TaxID=2017437 RepID=UPI003AF7AB2F
FHNSIFSETGWGALPRQDRPDHLPQTHLCYPQILLRSQKNERGQKLISGELDVSELEIDTST